MRVTIKQIAEAAGVSRGTVDRALNGRPGVKAEVEENIKRIARELGYKPNYAAKALADNRYSKKKIGVLLNSEGNAFFDEVLSGVKAALSELEEFGVDSIIRTMSGYDAQEQITLLNDLMQEQISGIVLTPVNAPEVVEKICTLREQGIEIVTVNTDVLQSGRLAYVGCNYKKSGAVAAGLIGMMNQGKTENYVIVKSSHRNLAVEQRSRGIIETLEKDFPLIRVTGTIDNEDSNTLSYKVVSELLKKNEKLDGICFAGAGHKGGIQAICDSGKKIKIITFDLTESIKMHLKTNIVAATVCQDPYRQGYDGIDIMGKYLLWNQKPEKEFNYTEITIATKYSVMED